MVRLALLCACALAGCAELGVVTDGTSVSVGRASRGYLIEGTRLPDKGVGFTTRELWLKRENRYGTDELVDLVIGVSRRMHDHVKDVKLVVADLSARGGGAAGASQFHRSHQSGRDADLVPYLRDAAGNPFEADNMHKLDWRGRASDGSGVTLDVPRTWMLVKELLSAPEAPVQYIFMYEPLCQMLIDHAKSIGEPEALVVKARRALRQPGDSARHDDHMHVRVYCSEDDRAYGCVDMGPMELLAEHQAEQRAQLAALAETLPPPAAQPAAAAPDLTLRAQLETVRPWGAELWTGESVPELDAIKTRLRARADGIDLRRWR